MEVKFTLHIIRNRHPETGRRHYEFFRIVDMPFAPFVGLNVHLIPDGEGYLTVESIWFDPSGERILECDFGDDGERVLEEKDWTDDCEWYRKQGFTVPND